MMVFKSYAQTVIYVKKGATGAGNGTSWANAYPELSTALTAATSISGNKEIWVAQGEYKPTATTDRTKSFSLSSAIFMYGGFAGTELSKDARNWNINRTVLSGDLGRQFDIADNSYHVVRANGPVTLDGFVIKYGNANGEQQSLGGGVFMENLEGGYPRFSNLIFQDNHAVAGSAMYVQNGASTGVAAYVSNCNFIGNQSQYYGTAFIVGSAAGIGRSHIVNCVFNGNKGGTDISAISAITPLDVVNCTFAYNQGRPVGNYLDLSLQNSISWKNYFGEWQDQTFLPAVQNSNGSSLVVNNNLLQGGHGAAADNNLDVDPLFLREPSVAGVHPRTSIIPVTSTNPKYENQLEFNGPRMSGPWPYYVFKDHTYNKTYVVGMNVQVLDYNNLVDNKPNSTVYYALSYPRTQRPDRAFHTASNSIYFAVYYNGIVAINRQTGVATNLNIAAGETGNFTALRPNDIVVDNTNNLLYCPFFEDPSGLFHGLLEYNLTTQTKRWITASSTPVSVGGGVVPLDDINYWGGFRIFLDEPANVLYYATGNGLWWWNRSTNATGLYNTTGGIPVAAGFPQLPSNLTTGMFVDNSENKVYIGTHQGLYVWNRNNNTSRVYNTANSKLIHNLINTVDKNDEFNLIYAACEDGALFVLNTRTGEESLITRDDGSPTYPQYMDVSAASAYYDEVDKKLYVSADHPTGGTWVADYNNLVPDYGDLRLQASSPAIDNGIHAALPSTITTDLFGLPRFVDYPSLSGANSLDLGAYERPFEESDAPPAPIPSNLGMNYILSYTAQREGVTNASSLDGFTTKDVNRAIQYFDGLGRPLQSIVIEGSPSKKDLITPVVYDEHGRETRKYLPFSKDNDGVYVPHSGIFDGNANYSGTPSAFYSGIIDPTIQPDTRPFSQTVFEPSPLNRPLKDYGPGVAWSPAGNDKPVTHHYLSNVHDASSGATVGEAIIAWRINAQGIPAPAAPVANYIVAGGYYSSGQLNIKVTIDEEGHAVREYVNKQGQTILKKVQAVSSGTPQLNNASHWAFTYYIYDDLDNLVYVLQPEGYKQYVSIGQQ